MIDLGVEILDFKDKTRRLKPRLYKQSPPARTKNIKGVGNPDLV